MQVGTTHLAAADRLRRLRRPFPCGWTREQFQNAAKEGKRRWMEAEELFGARWPMFQDAVTLIKPSFAMEYSFVDLAEATEIPSRSNVDNRIALWFMRWARCPQTADYPNPYEPWIEIWENGGSFSVEHGQFVDVYDASGVPVPGVTVRRA
jgi:hypothetical protein